MSSNTASSTPETTPMRAHNPIGRSVTMPTRLSNLSPSGATPDAGSAEGVETFFTASSANVIKFTAAAPRSSSGAGSANDAGNGTLPWMSATERPMAAGPLQIYCVPGSVSFLSSGAFLHAILPRSQCWCVDGVSKFVLRTVTPNTYYRVELPGTTPEDLQTVEAFKLTLAKISLYERTACPFARTFTVDVPEEKPKKKKAKRRDTEPVKKWKQHAYRWRREGDEDLEERESDGSTDSAEQSDSEDSRDLSTQEEASERENADERDIRGVDAPDETPTRPPRLAASRSATALPQLTLTSTPPSRLGSDRYPKATAEADAASGPVPNPLDPSRLRTFQAIPTDMPPSPPDSSAGLDWNETMGTIQVSTQASSQQPYIFTVDEGIEALDSSNDPQPDQPEPNMTGTADAVIPPPLADTILEHEDTPVGDSQPTTPSVFDSDEKERRGAPSTSYAVPAAEEISHTENIIEKHLDSETTILEAPETPTSQSRRNLHRSPEIEDQFAQIQARILARRSIGGSTTAFQPRARYASSSSSNASTLASDKSSISRASQRKMTAQQQALGAALARKACAVFLGPPAYLVAIMLRIARRFTNGARNFATTYVLRHEPLQMPGSFHVEDEGEEDSKDTAEAIGVDDAELEDLGDWLEDDETDDFGVPLRSPIRMALEARMTALDMGSSREIAVDDISDKT